MRLNIARNENETTFDETFIIEPGGHIIVEGKTGYPFMISLTASLHMEMD
jgi:hypothetical protein